MESFLNMAEMKPYVYYWKKSNGKKYLKIAIHIKKGFQLKNKDWETERDNCGVLTFKIEFENNSSVASPFFWYHEEEVTRDIKHRSPAYKVLVEWDETPGQGTTMTGQEDADDNP